MRLMIATGGTPQGNIALRFGAFLTARAGEAPTIVTVVKNEADRPRAEAILARAVDLYTADLAAAGEASTPRAVDPWRPRAIVRVGHPAEELVREAEEGDYGLAIVGDKQHEGLMSRFRLGSTAVRIIEHAPCPVAVAKGAVDPAPQIMVCDSGIQDPPLVGRMIEQLGALLRAGDEVTVLHVMSQISAGPSVRSEDLAADARTLMADRAPEGALLERDGRLLSELGLRVTPVVRHGFVVDEILGQARQGGYGAVVIGAHRGSGWRRILLDDLAHQLIELIDRPIVVVR